MPGEANSRREKIDEQLALKLAEETDVSPRQAKLLIERYGDNEEAIWKAARGFKAEG
jgi:hypothetical protein